MTAETGTYRWMAPEVNYFTTKPAKQNMFFLRLSYPEITVNEWNSFTVRLR